MRLSTGLLMLALGGLLASNALAAEHGYKGQCVGGTLAGARSDARLVLTGAENLVFSCGKLQFEVPYAKIHTLEYGQQVSRRYAAAVLVSPLLLLSKSRRHYVTLEFADREGLQQAIVFQIEKGDIRPVLASLEARTGRRVEYQDDEARKGSK